MLKRLRDMLAGADESAGGEPLDEERALRLATAALLVEMSRADFSERSAERGEILRALRDHFGLDLEAAERLLEQGSTRADRAVSLYEFTSLLHEQLDVAEKQKIVEMLWRVALADARLDKYEDHLVRKVAELLYVSHSDLMRLKHRVLGELDAGPD